MGVMLLVVVFIFYLQDDFNEKWFLLFYCFLFLPIKMSVTWIKMIVAE